MGEFFRGWRRKIGVVTLLMALMFMARWVRSGLFYDSLKLIVGPVDNWMCIRIISIDQQFGVVTTNGFKQRSPQKKIQWETHPTAQVKGGWENIFGHWKWRWIGFGIMDNSDFGVDVKAVFAPYWSITIPLTLVSVWLLLSKPRKSTSKKTVEPIPADGT